jgi:chloramphenicol 3-O phosphotransferase
VANVILLNGCSSAGKTTLALKLQQLLPEPYQHVALDQFRDGMPSRVRGFNSPDGDPGAQGLNVVPEQRGGDWVTKIEFGDYGERVLASMRRTIASLCQSGCSVIVDDLLFKRAYLDDYINVLEPKNTWFIGVHCNIEIVHAREAQRPGRFPGTATSHFEQIHQHGVAYDLEVDTSFASPKDVAEQIVARLATPPQAFAQVRQAQSER